MAESLVALHDRLRASASSFELLEAAYLKLAHENRVLKEALVAAEFRQAPPQPEPPTKAVSDDLSAAFLVEIQILTDQVEASEATIRAQEATIARLEESVHGHEMELLDMAMQLEMKSLRSDAMFCAETPLSPFVAAVQASAHVCPPPRHRRARSVDADATPALVLQAAYRDHAATLVGLERWQQVAREQAAELAGVREELGCREQVAVSLRHVIERQAHEHTMTMAAHRDAIHSLKEKLESQRLHLESLATVEAALSAATARLQLLEAAVSPDVAEELREKELALQAIQTSLRQHTLALNTRCFQEKALAAQVAIFCSDVATRLRALVLENESLKQARGTLEASAETHLQRIKDLKDQVHERDAVLRVLQEKLSSSHITTTSLADKGLRASLRLKSPVAFQRAPTEWL
ncbi:hypothetical protein ACHHYP_09139 [Achlya hypogyna]|uniref:Uncharacterized protein n=1 Tax=Achlya hypogyna TaxID=1202772 RepID=A0A1V9YNM4_ACHHY|nr:hypothetical protein ACHHYP_09139 [Achlya hypogyna]